MEVSQPITRLARSFGSILFAVGHLAAQILAHALPENWRVVVVDRNRCVPPIFLLKAGMLTALPSVP